MLPGKKAEIGGDMQIERNREKKKDRQTETERKTEKKE